MEVLQWIQRTYGIHFYKRFENGDLTLDELTDLMEEYAKYKSTISKSFNKHVLSDEEINERSYDVYDAHYNPHKGEIVSLNIGFKEGAKWARSKILSALNLIE